MRTLFVRSLWLSLSLVLVLGAAFRSSGFDDKDEAKAKAKDKDNPQTPIEVYEWSIWIGNPAQTSLNTARVYKNAMPGAVGTNRPKFEDKELEKKSPVAPLSVVQFFGAACKDVDVDLRAKKGLFLSHWPASTERAGRLQWFKSDLSASPPEKIPQSYLPAEHWFQKLRQNASALFLKHESHYERFIAYDAEVSIPIPVKIRGGPDEYTLQNLTSRRLQDIAVIAPTDKGFRVGWLDELPTAAPEKTDEADGKKEEPAAKKKDGAAAKKGEPAAKKKDGAATKKEEAAKKTDAEKAEVVFQEAETKKKAEEEEPTPLPAEGDANVRARVDQVLNRPIVVNVPKASRRQFLDLIAGQARLRYELDEKTLAKDKVNLNDTMEMNAGSIAARDALAEVLGGAGLSYRIAEDGRLYITTATRLAEEAEKKGKAIEGPPVKLVMPQPRKTSDPGFREVTRDTLVRRLVAQGLREDVVKLLLEQYGPVLFEPKELIVLVHLSRTAIDEAVLLDVFPPPKKMVRTALLVVYGVDPRLQDRARGLVQQLGDQSPKARESAEARLFEMGPVAVPVLEDALKDKDIEIVFRAERLLLKLNRQVP
jgi:hypothetical protein